MPTSVLVLTFDEEVNIDACLASVAWCDDVVVLDSFSSDATVSIAARRGARIVQRRFDDYASQRNFGLTEVAYKHPWVLMVDADERIPEDLRAELETKLPTIDGATTLFMIRRKDYLFGKWLRRAAGYPTWFGRLARVGRVWVERPVNEEYHTDGNVDKLWGHIDHYPFNKGFSAWIAKHDRYSTMEAGVLEHRKLEPRRLREIFTGGTTARRRALKSLLYSLPARPLVIFFALYVVRGGMFDGRAGLTFSLLRSWYEYMIDCKIRERVRRRQGLPV
jgi:glycosyltransferase involved in cell wall biosynthesis